MNKEKDNNKHTYEAKYSNPIKGFYNDFFLFFFNDLIFILIPLVILLIIYSIFSNNSFVEITALANFTFANIVLTSLSISEFVKTKTKIQNDFSTKLYAGLNLSIVLIIFEVILLSLILINDLNVLSFEIKTYYFCLANLGFLVIGIWYYYLVKIYFPRKQKKDLYSEKIESSALEYLNETENKLNNINSSIYSILHLNCFCEVEEPNTASQKRYREFNKKKELNKIESLIIEIENNFNKMKTELKAKTNKG